MFECVWMSEKKKKKYWKWWRNVVWAKDERMYKEEKGTQEERKMIAGRRIQRTLIRYEETMICRNERSMDIWRKYKEMKKERWMKEKKI